MSIVVVAVALLIFVIVWKLLKAFVKAVVFALIVAALLYWGLGAQAQAGQAPKDPTPWRTLEPGLELAAFDSPIKASIGDSRVHALRIDPARYSLRLFDASAPDHGAKRTAKGWADAKGLVAAINAGMYLTDRRTSVGMFRTGGHVNNDRLHKTYNAVLAFDPNAPGPDVPAVRIIDLACDEPGAAEQVAAYASAVQNMRLVGCQGENLWPKNSQKKHSSAVVATDSAGRILFLFIRSPYVVHELIEILKTLPIDMQRAFYVEGGPPAQLFVGAGGEELELVGSYETRHHESDAHTRAGRIPLVLGVQARRP